MFHVKRMVVHVCAIVEGRGGGAEERMGGMSTCVHAHLSMHMHTHALTHTHSLTDQALSPSLLPAHPHPHPHPHPLQPGYITAWNNLGDAYESKKQFEEAYAAYKEVLSYSPENKVAQQRGEYCKTRLQRMQVM
jgi:tetratricopeptide (TPR) repeat protein